MNETIALDNQTFHYKKTVTILAVIALAFLSASYIHVFWAYVPIGVLKFAWRPRIPHIQELLYLIFDLAPYVLFLLCITDFQEKKYRSKVLFGMAILIGANPIIEFILYQIAYWEFFSWGNLIYLIVDLSIMLPFTLFAYSILQGFQRKNLVTFSLGVAILSSVGHLIYEELRDMLFYSSSWAGFQNNLEYYFYSVGEIIFYIALLIFSLKKPQKQKPKKEISPERQLRLIQDEFDRGKISYEEYRAQRADIISKL